MVDFKTMIFAGSHKDKPHVDEIVKELRRRELPFDFRIASAHKQSPRLNEFIEKEGERTLYISVAGKTDALSGRVSWEKPTISCPPEWRKKDEDKRINGSSLGNPSGSSNGYIPNPAMLADFIYRVSQLRAAPIFVTDNKTAYGSIDETLKSYVNESRAELFDNYNPVAIKQRMAQYGMIAPVVVVGLAQAAQTIAENYDHPVSVSLTDDQPVPINDKKPVCYFTDPLNAIRFTAQLYHLLDPAGGSILVKERETATNELLKKEKEQRVEYGLPP